MAETTSTATLPEIPTGTTLGPLFTFEAPSSCDFSSTYLVEAQALGYKFYQHGPQSSNNGCMPSGWALNAFYSGGDCPQSYTPACTDVGHDEKTTICCPDDGVYTCADAIWYGRYGCVSSFTPTVTITSLTGIGDTTSTWSTAKLASSNIWAYSVQIRNTQPATSTGGTDSSSSSSSSSGLSSGAVAGIVVGVVAAVAIPLLIGMFFFWRRARDAKQAEAPQAPVQQQYAGGQWQNAWRAPQELHEQAQMAELPLSQRTAELPSSSSPDSSSTQRLKPTAY